MNSLARELSGDVVEVSVFADCPSFYWNYDSQEDLALQDEMLRQLGIAVDWISEQAESCGQDVHFIYDWTEDPALMTTDSFTMDIVLDSASCMW